MCQATRDGWNHWLATATLPGFRDPLRHRAGQARNASRNVHAYRAVPAPRTCRRPGTTASLVLGTAEDGHRAVHASIHPQSSRGRPACPGRRGRPPPSVSTTGPDAGIASNANDRFPQLYLRPHMMTDTATRAGTPPADNMGMSSDTRPAGPCRRWPSLGSAWPPARSLPTRSPTTRRDPRRSACRAGQTSKPW
jgi:hypothetical protein